MTVVNTAPPVISDTTPQSGQSISSTSGTWTFDLNYLTYEYQWERCDAAGANCVDIAGATHSNYTVTLADVGHELRVRVTATEHASPSPPSEPAPIAGLGYSLAFEDDFTTLDTTYWRLGRFYLPEKPEFFSVSNSILRITTTSALGYEPHDLQGRERSSAWQYGYFECRMRYTRDPASFAAFWLISDNSVGPGAGPCTTIKAAEIDIYEAFHNVVAPGTYHGSTHTLHRNTGNGCGMADSTNSNAIVQNCGFDLADNWRTYSCLWTPTTLKWYIDETLIIQNPVFDTTNQLQRMYITCHGHGSSGPATLYTEVDWVRVWQL
jgi:hypothetical protein